MNNVAMYGFRLHRGRHARGIPPSERMIVATGQTFPVNGGAATPSLHVGDVIRRTTTGGAVICDGTEGGGGTLAPYGVVAGIDWQWSAAESRMIKASKLASGIAWGTNLQRQSAIFVIPVEQAVWEVDVDENTTATTLALYQDMIGENVDHINTGASGEDSIAPLLDISTNATTNTLVWQIVGVSPNVANRDFSGTRVKLLVVPNIWQDTSTTGT